MQQQLHTTPPRSKFNISGLRAEDRKAVDEGINEVLKLVPEKTFATLVYLNSGQTFEPPAGCTYQPFEITTPEGTLFDDRVRCVPIYSNRIIVRLFTHESQAAQKLFQTNNPLLFDSDSSYSKQVMSIMPN